MKDLKSKQVTRESWIIYVHPMCGLAKACYLNDIKKDKNLHSLSSLKTSNFNKSDNASTVI